MHVIVVDGSAQDVTGEAVFAWSGYAEGGRVTSIPRHVEQHGERFRSRYLAFVHDLGETGIAGRPLREHFRIGEAASLWWLNRVPEKSPFKSPRIFDCLRLLALEELLAASKASRVTLQTADRALRDAVGTLCAAMSVEFVWARREAPRRAWSMRRLYEALPWSVQGLLSLRHLLRRWPFRRLRPRQWFEGPAALFACSYFYAIDETAAAQGAFRSRQWEGLPECLQSRGARFNWVHHYQPDGPRDVGDSTALLETFNSHAEQQGRHVFVETYASWRQLAVIVRRWLWLHVVGLRVRAVPSAFRPRGSAAWLWPFLEQDWWNSLHGTAAVSNCTWITLFDRILADVPRQPRGLYLYEGQGWESAFVQAWRKHGHGELIAVPHSSMPFWYLNIYDDARCLPAESACGKPLPDRWAVNGPMAWRAFTEAGYPEARLVPVEALRYTYLQPFLSAGGFRAAGVRDGGGDVRVLVLGDFTRAQTVRMLTRLRDALPLVDRRCTVTVKLHPACRLADGDAAGLAWELTDRPLVDLLTAFDVAFVSNSTSGGLDALVAGLPVIAFLDEGELNQSPLRGSARAAFVGTAAELAAALRDAAERGRAASDEEFFWIDARLPRWQRALLTAGAHA